MNKPIQLNEITAHIIIDLINKYIYISPREGNSYPVQYSGLKNSMDCIVHEVTELDMTE